MASPRPLASIHQWLIIASAECSWRIICGVGLLSFVCFAVAAHAAEPDAAAAPKLAQRFARLEEFVQTYCLDCHSRDERVAGFEIESLRLPTTEPLSTDDHKAWELAYKRVASRQMPPPDADRPNAQQYADEIANMGRMLDALGDRSPVIPDVPLVRRMTRTEYQNTIRDLLHVEMDANKWLPRDESSQGFDNITTSELSPALVSRYLSVAQRISRIAVGRPIGVPIGLNVRLPADLTQDRHLAGLPYGTRGGVNIRNTFAESGVYQLSIRLMRDRDEKVEGLNRKAQVDVLIDGKPVRRFDIIPPKNRDYSHVDDNLKLRFPIAAGPHNIAVTFPGDGEPLLETRRQPFDAAYNRHRHPRQNPAIFEVVIVGPLTDSAEAESLARLVRPGDFPAQTPSRKRIFVARPVDDSIEAQLQAAKAILRPLARRAFRRDVTDDDLATALRFFREAVETTTNRSSGAEVTTGGGAQETAFRFDTGIEMAIASILVNPHFLLRTERPPADASSVPAAISDFELASRLSYFLWSSTPDDELLNLASQNRLSDPEALTAQVDRLLGDPRSSSLVTNFADQWLHLRNLGSVKPDQRRFPDFDENLRRAMRLETQSLFADVMRRNASVLELIDSPFTFLNHRLAKHYGIGGVLGSHFRRVDLRGDEAVEKNRRGGILRHASILAVTSYATRTSPTIRGNWILENLVATPPPPPPPNVPALKGKTGQTATSVRERLAQHRENPACANCHNLIDPVGFALEEFDAVGRWRAYDGETRIDSSGTLPDGTEVSSVADLERSLLDHPEQFVTAMVEKLMTFGLGRGVDYRDAPTIRQIVRDAKSKQFRFSVLIHKIVHSPAFRYRSHPPKPTSP